MTRINTLPDSRLRRIWYAYVDRKSVGEISDWFGFENQFHFSRIFKKCTV
jgi:AraC-like DNA-binding protein